MSKAGLDSLLQACNVAYKSLLEFEQVARARYSEIIAPILTALGELETRGEGTLKALVLAGEHDVREWYSGLVSVQDQLSRKLNAGKGLDNRILDVVINAYNYRHFRYGIAYTAAEVADDEVVKSHGISELDVVGYITQKRKDVAAVNISEETHYGVRVNRDIRFVIDRLKTLRDQGVISARDLDIINFSSLGVLLSANHEQLGYKQELNGKTKTFRYVRLPQAPKEKILRPEDFKYTVGSIARELRYEVEEVRRVRRKLLDKHLLVREKHYIVRSGEKGEWHIHRFSQEGYRILRRYLDQELEKRKKPAGIKAQIKSQQPKKRKTPSVKELLREGKNYIGKLDDAVHEYIYEHPEQKRFVLGELAKYFGTKSSPIDNVLKSSRKDLVRKEVEGRIVYYRI